MTEPKDPTPTPPVRPEAKLEKLEKYERELAEIALTRNPNASSEMQALADKIRRRRLSGK